MVVKAKIASQKILKEVAQRCSVKKDISKFLRNLHKKPLAEPFF